MANKQNHLDQEEKHVLIMFDEVCKHCQGSISITGSAFEYVFVRCRECGSEYLGGYTAITQTLDLEVVSD